MAVLVLNVHKFSRVYSSYTLSVMKLWLPHYSVAVDIVRPRTQTSVFRPAVERLSVSSSVVDGAFGAQDGAMYIAPGSRARDGAGTCAVLRNRA